VEKRKKHKRSNKKAGLDITKLSNSQEDLEKIIESAFSSVASKTLDDGELDVKYLKDLTSTLKEAVNIKRNIYLLPVLEEQKKREQELRDNPPAQNIQTNEICILLESDTEKYSI